MKICSSAVVVSIFVFLTGCATTTMQRQEMVRIAEVSPQPPPIITQQKQKSFSPRPVQSIFNSPGECLDAVESGSYLVYEPKHRGNAKKNIPNNKDIFLTQVEQTGCIRMDTVGGTGGNAKFVILKEGMQIRIDSFGKPLFDHRCGNRLYGSIEYPSFEKRDIPRESKIVMHACPPRNPNELPGRPFVKDNGRYCAYDAQETAVVQKSDFSLSEALLCGVSGAFAGAAGSGFTNPFAPAVGFGIGFGSQTIGRYFGGETGGRVGCMFGVAGAGVFGALGPFSASHYRHNHHHHEGQQSVPPGVDTSPAIVGPEVNTLNPDVGIGGVGLDHFYAPPVSANGGISPPYVTSY